MQIEKAFPQISLPQRAGKPRECGLTMMIDWGLPLGHQIDKTDSAGHYIDMAKIAAIIAGLMSKEILKEKLISYAAVEISTSQGDFSLSMHT